MSTNEVDGDKVAFRHMVRDCHMMPCDRILWQGYLQCVGEGPMGALAAVADGSQGCFGSRT